MHELKTKENIFYEDQNSVCECVIIEEVDVLYKMEVEFLNSTL